MAIGNHLGLQGDREKQFRRSVGLRAVKLRRIHPNDGHGNAIHANGLTQRIGGPPEPSRPIRIADNGHRRRRQEGMPFLVDKFKTNLRRSYTEDRQQKILEASLDRERLEQMAVNEYVDLYVP